MLPELIELNRLLRRAVRNNDMSEEDQEQAHKINNQLLQNILTISDKDLQHRYYERAISGYFESFDLITVELEYSNTPQPAPNSFDEYCGFRYLICRGFMDIYMECANHSLLPSKELLQGLMARYSSSRTFYEHCTWCMFEDQYVRSGGREAFHLFLESLSIDIDEINNISNTKSKKRNSHTMRPAEDLLDKSFCSALFNSVKGTSELRNIVQGKIVKEVCGRAKKNSENWTWAHVRRAMVRCGFFGECPEGKKPQWWEDNAISDKDFGHAINSCAPDITAARVKTQCINHKDKHAICDENIVTRICEYLQPVVYIIKE